MATFRKKIMDSKIDAKREIEKIRNELKCQELFYEKKLSKVKLMAITVQVDLENRQLTTGIQKSKQIIDFLSNPVEKSEQIHSRSRSRSRISTKRGENLTNRQSSVEDVTHTDRITYHNYSSTSNNNSQQPLDDEPQMM
jgi:hypothetical protein